MVFFILAALADYYSRFGGKFLNWGPGNVFSLGLGVTKVEYVNSPKSADSALSDFQLSQWLSCTRQLIIMKHTKLSLRTLGLMT